MLYVRSLLKEGIFAHEAIHESIKNGIAQIQRSPKSTARQPLNQRAGHGPATTTTTKKAEAHAGAKPRNKAVLRKRNRVPRHRNRVAATQLPHQRSRNRQTSARNPKDRKRNRVAVQRLPETAIT